MTSKKYSPKEIAGIILSCLNETVTSDQQERLENWLAECETNRKFYERLENEHYRAEQMREFAHYDSRQDWQKVKSQLRRGRKNIFYRFLPYAAVLVLGLSLWTVIYSKYSFDNKVVVSAPDSIEPGYARACLILPDGLHLDLDAKRDTVVKHVNFVNSGNTLTYSDSGVAVPDKHVLRIPRGGEYHLLLSDGTGVWLNAETELRYPAYFTGNIREVELTGEAYFEVTKDATRPFYVKTAGMTVKVLGTSFNVRAYARENEQATLVSGKVEIACAGKTSEIRPGEQLTLGNGGAEIRKVNVNNYVDWKEQRFAFDDKMLVEVLSDLERWYDVHVFVADNAVQQLRFTANLPKYENLDKVLEIIELAACVKCEVKDRTVVVRMDWE